MQNRRVWICGANGMLGSHFQRLLGEKQIPFLANGHRQIDITDRDAVAAFVRVQKITHIINCAAYTQVDKAESEPEFAYKANAMGPAHLGLAARKYGARVIHFSTDYVFNGFGKQPYKEEQICSPLGAYGMSKLAGEVKLLDVLPEACIIRTSWLFGHPGKNFVDTMLKLMSQRDSLRIVVDQIGRPTYCQDLADAALEMLDLPGLFHFANQGETSWFDFASEIQRQALDRGVLIKPCALEPIPTSGYPTPAKRPAYSSLNTNKIEQQLGRCPRSWQAALSDYLLLYQQSPTLQISHANTLSS